MPMNRSLYPADWDAIALRIKQDANWTCEACQRPCRRPGETDEELIDRIESDHPDWVDDLREWQEDDEFGAIEIPKLGRFTLTVAHLNHIPQDCSPENLKPWCAPCHCRYDLKAMATKRRLKREYHGQLTLEIMQETE